MKNGPLSKHIEEGLRRSRCLVVLVDSTTRESPWVDTEITTWLENGGSAEKLFLIKTDQVDLTWDEEKKISEVRNSCHLPCVESSRTSRNSRIFWCHRAG